MPRQAGFLVLDKVLNEICRGGTFVGGGLGNNVDRSNTDVFDKSLVGQVYNVDNKVDDKPPQGEGNTQGAGNSKRDVVAGSNNQADLD